MSANLAALRTVAGLEAQGRAATADELQVLARWSSWGAVPQIFDEARPEWAGDREQLRALLDEPAYAAARRTVINAHYTDPAYVAAVWGALERLGFAGGEVLEPGAGSGTFIGMAPAGARMTGVELDPSTARIAEALYPQATVRAESFAATRFPGGHFDATVGNVPFADVRLHDPRHNRGGHSLHNHFILKSLDLTRPGGVVAVLTSSYTMDGQNPAARREMSGKADLLGAVRLPTGAHRRAAGTEVVTDLLLLRRREQDREPLSTVWETTRPLRLEGEVIRVNNYFGDHPEHVLGEVGVGHGMYGAATMHVRGEVADTPRALGSALAGIVDQALVEGRGYTPRAQGETPAAAVVAAGDSLWDGHITAARDGSFTVVDSGVHTVLQVPGAQAVELRRLLGLRDTAKALLSAEAATGEDTAEIDGLRSELAGRYRDYTGAHGPINRFTLRATGRVDPVTGEPKLARLTPRVMATMRTDPFFPLVGALEVFDDTTQTATPATLLAQRVVLPRTPVLGADTAADALTISLETHGRVDLREIARLTGLSEDEARADLTGLVFTDPGTRALVPAAEYLSGNVRSKLAAAAAAAEQDPASYAHNVTALSAVVPSDLGMDEVEPRLGAAWIDAGTHREFLAEVLGDDGVKVEHPGAALWEVRGNTWSVAATSEWGTDRMPATAIAKAVLEQRPIQVTDENEDGRRILNPEATAAAQEKAGALQERFADWVWEDPDRANRLLREYNDRFNALVLRDYTAEGQRLTLPGLASTFTPREHQRTAVARMLSEPAVGLFHQVGAGKTAEMVIGTMELKRLGMASKPVVVVPNHMLEQFSREWLQLYPQARLLAASSGDLAGDKRRQFVARTATNDWDAVIMTRSAFERIPMSQAAQAGYVDREIDSLRAMLERAKDGDGLTVKRLEKMVLAGEQRLESRVDGVKDAGLTFEETGIDYLVVDEMHDYKNLRTVSNIRDAAIEGSKRATDLHMKVEYLRDRHGDRVITAATATPIANSVTEAHVMQRYLRPDLLRDAGVEDFDAWAATFGQTVTEIEMAPTGGGNYRQATRFAKFQNVPEMLRMWHVFADVKTAEDLALPTPDLLVRPDGQRLPVTVTVEPTTAVREYVAHLGDRAEQVRARAVPPEIDNMLKISTDGRKAALDMRLVRDLPTAGTSKLDVAADNIARIWHENSDRPYLDPDTGATAARPGALQLVFCDLGTPGPNWNAYDELRSLLVERAVPRAQVRFIHEANNDVEKGRLFAAARNGQVGVLVGSTQKMGVGTNVQARAVAEHHLDCPWRPADLEQRDGRILRQGNQNPEVGIYRYVVEGSFDAYSWQTVERKAKFIAQIMRGRLDMREMDDVGDNALSFAEVKALASGDPLVLEKATADAELTRLERLGRAYQRNLQGLDRTVVLAQLEISAVDAALPATQAAIAASQATAGESFSMTVAGQRHDSRADAAEALRTWAAGNVPPFLRGRDVELGAVARLGGLDINAAARTQWGSSAPVLVLTVHGVPTDPVSVTVGKLGDGAGLGIVRQLEHRLVDLPALEQRLHARRDTAVTQQAAAREALTRPFKHSDALTAARARATEINDAMRTRNDQKDTTSDTPEAPPPTALTSPPSPAASPARLAAAAFGAPIGAGTRTAPPGTAGEAATPTPRPVQRPTRGHRST